MPVPAKRRVEPGGRRPPPPGRLVPDPGLVDPVELSAARRISRPGDVGESLRDWRRGGAQPQWVRAIGWTIVISFLLPLVLAAWNALAT